MQDVKMQDMKMSDQSARRENTSDSVATRYCGNGQDTLIVTAWQLLPQLQSI